MLELSRAGQAGHLAALPKLLHTGLLLDTIRAASRNTTAIAIVGAATRLGDHLDAIAPLIAAS